VQKQAHLQEVGAVLPAAEVGDGPRRGSMRWEPDGDAAVTNPTDREVHP
jgi:hypothetical protein